MMLKIFDDVGNLLSNPHPWYQSSTKHQVYQSWDIQFCDIVCSKTRERMYSSILVKSRNKDTHILPSWIWYGMSVWNIILKLSGMSVPHAGIYMCEKSHIDGLVQERRNSSVLAMELCISCIYPSIKVSLPRSRVLVVFDWVDDHLVKTGNYAKYVEIGLWGGFNSDSNLSRPLWYFVVWIWVVDHVNVLTLFIYQVVSHIGLCWTQKWSLKPNPPTTQVKTTWPHQVQFGETT